jgi:hypothetical protein
VNTAPGSQIIDNCENFKVRLGAYPRFFTPYGSFRSCWPCRNKARVKKHCSLFRRKASDDEIQFNNVAPRSPRPSRPPRPPKPPKAGGYPEERAPGTSRLMLYSHEIGLQCSKTVQLRVENMALTNFSVCHQALGSMLWEYDSQW